MSKICLDGSGVDAIVLTDRRLSDGPTAFGDEQVRRFRIRALELTQRTQFPSRYRVRRHVAVLCAVHGHRTPVQIKLIPAQTNQFAHAKPMSVMINIKVASWRSMTTPPSSKGVLHIISNTTAVARARQCAIAYRRSGTESAASPARSRLISSALRDTDLQRSGPTA